MDYINMTDFVLIVYHGLSGMKNKAYMTVVTCEPGTAFPPERICSPLAFSGVRVARSLVFCVVIEDHCLYFRPFPLVLYCLSFLDSRLLITLWYLQTFFKPH